MSDPNKPKPLPPDDFSATTPNFKLPKNDAPNYGNAPVSDWEKTNYNYSPKDLQADQWKAPTPNQPSNFGNASKQDEWGMTQANIKVPYNQGNPQPNQPDYGSQPVDYGATTPFIKLPDNVKAEYQDTGKPAKFKFGDETEEEEKQEEKKKGGIPGWAWATGGLFLMFLFAVAVLLAVWFFIFPTRDFEIVVKGAPPRSDYLVDGSNWGVTTDEGSAVRLRGLKPGSKTIEIKNKEYKCEAESVKGEGGQRVEITARCTQVTASVQTPKVDEKCLKIKAGDFETSRQCAYTELDKLEKAGSWTVEQLLFAMNLYIVNFASGSSTLQPIDLKFVSRASEFIKKLPPATVIEVGGHTDNKGTDAKNQPLSEARANAVKNALVQFGINPAMLQTKGYGSKKPKDGNTNADENERFRNRRIEYSVVSK